MRMILLVFAVPVDGLDRHDAPRGVLSAFTGKKIFSMLVNHRRTELLADN